MQFEILVWAKRGRRTVKHRELVTAPSAGQALAAAHYRAGLRGCAPWPLSLHLLGRRPKKIQRQAKKEGRERKAA